MDSPTRNAIRIPFLMIGFMALAAVFSLGVLGSMAKASAQPETYRTVTGTGIGTITVNNVTEENINIDFSAATNASGEKIVNGAFTMTRLNGEVIGSGTVESGELGDDDLQLKGILGANGILGVNGGKDFKIISKIGVDAPVKFDGRLPGGGCRGSFTAMVEPMDAEPT
jgi:hypothetical protein